MAVKKKQPSRSRPPRRPKKRPARTPPPPLKKRGKGAASPSLPHGRKSKQSQKKSDSRRNKQTPQVVRNRQKSVQQAKKKPLRHLPEQTAGKTPGLGAGSSEKKAIAKKLRKHLVVTTKEERALVEHMELRDEVITSGVLDFPDQRLHKVQTALPSQGIHAGGPWSRIPRRGISKNTFIREELTQGNLTEILFQAKNAIVAMTRKKPNWDIFASLHMTEYGLNLYGSDKMELLSKAFKTEALHRTVMGFPMAGSVEAMMFIMEARLEARLRDREDAGTTAIVEYINVSLFEQDPEKTIAREDTTPGGTS